VLRPVVRPGRAGLTTAIGPHVRGILLDIEGTTTPLTFVTETLFPFARAHAREFLERRGAEPAVRDDVAMLAREHRADACGPPPWSGDLDSIVAYVEFLMDRDRKSTGLKALQGRIWEEGFRAGDLRGAVYPDVPRALARWREQGRRTAIFSSGSVLAQRLLFAHTDAGDLTPFLDGYFDTTTGPKRDPASYRTIAAALGMKETAVLFVSDVAEELDAARAAGMETALCLREEGTATPSADPVVTTFDGLLP
jgi:enolase-phosphatase E1